MNFFFSLRRPQYRCDPSYWRCAGHRAFPAPPFRPRRLHRHCALGRRPRPPGPGPKEQGRPLPFHRPAAVAVRSAEQPARLLPSCGQRNGGQVRGGAGPQVGVYISAPKVTFSSSFVLWELFIINLLPIILTTICRYRILTRTSSAFIFTPYLAVGIYYPFNFFFPYLGPFFLFLSKFVTFSYFSFHFLPNAIGIYFLCPPSARAGGDFPMYTPLLSGGSWSGSSHCRS
jgi:hypothetical protein